MRNKNGNGKWQMANMTNGKWQMDISPGIVREKGDILYVKFIHFINDNLIIQKSIYGRIYILLGKLYNSFTFIISVLQYPSKDGSVFVGTPQS